MTGSCLVFLKFQEKLSKPTAPSHHHLVASCTVYCEVQDSVIISSQYGAMGILYLAAELFI